MGVCVWVLGVNVIELRMNIAIGTNILSVYNPTRRIDTTNIMKAISILGSL